MDYVTVIGLVAGFFTTAALLPEVIKCTTSKCTTSLSYLWMGMAAFGTGLWLVYGLLLNSLPLIAANFVSVILYLVLVALKVKYK